MNDNSARAGPSCPAGANAASGAVPVPVISITYAPNEQETEVQTVSPSGRPDSWIESPAERGTPRVFVCCMCNHHAKEDKLHRHVLHALQHRFYVRSGPCADDRQGPRWDDLREADACVFVLDDPSLKAPTWFQGLCAAWAFDIPTVFLKDSNYSLPTPLPDVILQHNLGLGASVTSRASTSARSTRSHGATTECGPGSRGGAYFSPSPPGPRSSSVTSVRSQRRLSQRRTKQEVRDSDMVLQLMNGYRDALVFDETRHEDCEGELRKTVHSLLCTGQSEMPCGGRRSPRPVPKSPNSLHPLSKRTGSSRRHRRSLLGVPLSQAATAYFLSDGDDDDDVVFSYPSSPSHSSASFGSDTHFSFSDSDYTPSPTFLSNGQTLDTSSSSSPASATNGLSVSPAPSLQITPATLPLPTTPSSGRSSSSFTHLHQVQQRFQQYRARVLSSSSSIDDVDALENFDGRQTTYMVCSRSRHSPNAEPRLVKWPPSSEDEMMQQEEEVDRIMSGSLSDSPVSFMDFRDLDLSMVVNKPRSLDTPDSDASIF